MEFPAPYHPSLHRQYCTLGTSLQMAAKRRKGKRRRTTPARKSPRAKSRAKPKQKRSSKRKAKKSQKRARSKAAKKGWAKRRKRKRLVQAMADYREQRSDQPLGWIERRATVRSIAGGKIWQQISFDFDITARNRARLAELERLGMDLLSKDDLYDHLSWMADELEIDISDMYRMYLGYPPSGEQEAAAE